MRTAEALATLARARFVPVVRAPSAALAVVACRALAAGGCLALEVTFTTPGAVEAIATLAAEGLFVGAGTVRTLAQAEAAWAAGAAFLVSPHLPPAVLAAAQAADRLHIPGALTPGEVLAALDAGAPMIKIFPVESLGGPRYLKLLGDPLPGVKFFPTGGVTLSDTPAYLAAGAVAVGVGTALAPFEAVAGADLALLEANARTWTRALLRP